MLWSNPPVLSFLSDPSNIYTHDNMNRHLLCVDVDDNGGCCCRLRDV